jgi:thiamine biosynthesis lipoprotein
MRDPSSNRREFLTGQVMRGASQQVGDTIADQLVSNTPSRGPTVMLRTTAMATDFDVILNPGGPEQQVAAASDALDEVHRLEAQLTVYRDDSEIAAINRTAQDRPVAVEPDLYRLLKRAAEIRRLTDRAFDPASGALIQLWRGCRREARIPMQDEVSAALGQSGMRHIRFDDESRTISVDRAGMAFDLGAIGKGYAVDRAGDILIRAGVENWLVHGGKSSVLARGTHGGHDGWPIGLRNPLLPDRPFFTLLLKDAALSTSGTAVNWFRHEGKRYGHILDPRTGWPVETMLSVSVVAPDAALSDALSTAFFVLGVEKALEYCDNFPEVSAVLFPLPGDGRTLDPILYRVPPETLFWEAG